MEAPVALHHVQSPEGAHLPIPAQHLCSGGLGGPRLGLRRAQMVASWTPPPQPPVCHAGTLGDVFVFITKRLGHNEAHKAFAALLVLLPHAAAELLLHLQSIWSPHVLLRSSKMLGGHYGSCIACL